MYERHPPPIGDLARRLVDDVNSLVKDHADLARQEIRKAGIDAVAAVLSGFVAVIGFAMLCATLVVALEPVIPDLWLRMLLCSIAYLVLGGSITMMFLRKLKGEFRWPKRASARSRRSNVTSTVPATTSS